MQKDAGACEDGGYCDPKSDGALYSDGYRLSDDRKYDGRKHLLTVIRQLAENLRKDGPRTVVVTGIQFCDNEDGIQKMGNLAVTGKRHILQHSRM